MLVEGNDDARYVVVFDPLDGSSNIDASIPTGEFFTCFSYIGSIAAVAFVFSLEVSRYLPGVPAGIVANSAENFRRFAGRAHLESFSRVFSTTNG